MSRITTDLDPATQPLIAAAMKDFHDDLIALFQKYCPVLQEHMAALDPRLVEEMKQAPVHFHPVVSLISGVGIPAALEHLMAQNPSKELGLAKALTLPMALCDAVSNTARMRGDEYNDKTGSLLAKVLDFETPAPDPVQGAAEIAIEPGKPNPDSPWVTRVIADAE